MVESRSRGYIRSPALFSIQSQCPFRDARQIEAREVSASVDRQVVCLGRNNAASGANATISPEIPRRLSIPPRSGMPARIENPCGGQNHGSRTLHPGARTAVRLHNARRVLRYGPGGHRELPGEPRDFPGTRLLPRARHAARQTPNFRIPASPTTTPYAERRGSARRATAPAFINMAH